MPAPAKAKKPDLAAIFDAIRAELERYSPPYAARSGGVKNKRDYHLVSEKQVTIAGRKYPELCFASVIQQKDFVGFYYMPIYGKPAIGKELAPELLKLLKGKSCFHIKSHTPELRKQIAAALETGHAYYKKNGWV